MDFTNALSNTLSYWILSIHSLNTKRFGVIFCFICTHTFFLWLSFLILILKRKTYAYNYCHCNRTMHGTFNYSLMVVYTTTTKESWSIKTLLKYTAEMLGALNYTICTQTDTLETHEKHAEKYFTAPYSNCRFIWLNENATRNDNRNGDNDDDINTWAN